MSPISANFLPRLFKIQCNNWWNVNYIWSIHMTHNLDHVTTVGGMVGGMEKSWLVLYVGWDIYNKLIYSVLYSLFFFTFHYIDLTMKFVLNIQHYYIFLLQSTIMNSRKMKLPNILVSKLHRINQYLSSIENPLKIMSF